MLRTGYLPTSQLAGACTSAIFGALFGLWAGSTLTALPRYSVNIRPLTPPPGTRCHLTQWQGDKATPLLLLCALLQRIGVDVFGYGYTASVTLPLKHQPNKLLKLPVAPGATNVAAFKAPLLQPNLGYRLPAVE